MAHNDTSIPDGYKRCSLCEEILPATLEYFHKGAGNAGGLRPLCKHCRSLVSRSTYKQSPIPLVHSDETKACGRCSELYPADLTHFYQAKTNHDGLSSRCKKCVDDKNKEYAIAHPEAGRKAKRKYKQVHPDKVREQERRRIARPHNREKQRIFAKRYYWENPERSKQSSRRYRAAHPDKIKAWSIKRRGSNNTYRQTHPELRTVEKQRRRARKLALPATLSPTDWQHCLDYFHHTCAICNRPQGLWHTLAMDHWIPLSSPDCPGTIPTNIIPLCHGIDGCNNQKGSKDPAEWLTAKFGPRKAKQILDRVQSYFDSLKDPES